MQIKTSISGSHNIEKWLADKAKGSSKDKAFLESMGSKGVAALAANTPKRSGGVANGWTYKVFKDSRGWTLNWYNNGHPELSVNLAILLQYGHGTRNGGYVPGRDYINPALKPVFEQITDYFLKGD
jgi:hypothetical protein